MIGTDWHPAVPGHEPLRQTLWPSTCDPITLTLSRIARVALVSPSVSAQALSHSTRVLSTATCTSRSPADQ
ncbi:hypothetical protein V9T40_007666 [Parthenolecanium corni]|uniref:Uncharacterized protein n=1 Tax=Parthenolecanium corni TaxID=536013 RepID=A0AAN9Y4D7_9HEMI